MLKIGWASRDVSTADPVGIGGQKYERISKGILDPTTITVLLMEDGVDQVIFISGDFTSIDDGLLKEVRSAVGERVSEAEVGKIIFNSTHTHTAPRYQRKSVYDKAPKDRVNIADPEKYRQFLIRNVTDAVAEAFERREEGSFSFGFGSASVAHHRRALYFNDQGAKNELTTYAVNGHAVMYGKTNTEDFSGFEGVLDHNVFLIFTFDRSENLTGAVINVPCPSQCTGHHSLTSADFWHETRTLIRKKYGDIFILPQCAAAGDLAPFPIHGLDALERKNRLKYADDPKGAEFLEPYKYYLRKSIAEKLAAAFDECYAWASMEKISDASIVHSAEVLSLDAWKVTKQEYEVAKDHYAEFSKKEFAHTEDPMEDFKENTALSGQIARCEQVIGRYEADADFVQAEIHVLKIGEIAFVTCPFELYLDYQHRIQSRSPFVQTFIVELTGSDPDAKGYLSTERAAKNKGYSAIMYSCKVSPDGGQKLVEEALRKLKEIK